MKNQNAPEVYTSVELRSGAEVAVAGWLLSLTNRLDERYLREAQELGLTDSIAHRPEVVGRTLVVYSQGWLDEAYYRLENQLQSDVEDHEYPRQWAAAGKRLATGLREDIAAQNFAHKLQKNNPNLDVKLLPSRSE